MGTRPAYFAGKFKKTPVYGGLKLQNGTAWPVRQSSSNLRDLQVIANRYDPSQRLPILPTSDGVGEIVAVGAGVSRVKIGDRVIPPFAQGWVAGERSCPRWLTQLGGHYDGLLQEYCILEAE